MAMQRFTPEEFEKKLREYGLEKTTKTIKKLYLWRDKESDKVVLVPHIGSNRIPDSVLDRVLEEVGKLYPQTKS